MDERYAMTRRSETNPLAGRTAPASLSTSGTNLRVYLLGPPCVEWVGCPCRIHRRQARALFYRLAARLEPVSREHLCFLFWSDIPESTARRHLSHLLTHLRRALPDPAVLLDYDDQVGLDAHRVWSDVVAFERLCAALTSISLRGVRGEVLQQAVDLYRGPFLNGFSLPTSPEFEAWATQERYTWERLYLEALAILIGERAARKEYDAAIAYARRYLATDDLAEDMHRRLIELYTAVGDRSAALRQFERCAVVLERELGVSPLPETRAVYQAILEGQPSPRPVTRPAWTILPGLDVPLVGRDRALGWLDQAYARAQSGHGGVVLISGEPGIGKSRLIQEFATRLQDRALILSGAGYLDTRTMSYQPIVQALRSAFHTSRFAFPMQPVWLAEASRLLPELRTLYPDLPPPLPAEPDEARSRLFEALCQIILGLSAGFHPALLCLDDLHWADSATLDWLAYLGCRVRDSRDRPGGCPLLIIGSYRSEEADAVGVLCYSLTRLGVLSELRLWGLDEAAVLQLLRHLTHSSPHRGEGEVARRLQQATGGNPFFLLETLRLLIESGRPLEELIHAEDLPLPDTVREAVEARLERLSPVARQVVEAGAILGPTFNLDLVRLTAGRREMETMDGLDELVARQLLVEHDPRYGFQHEMIRRIVKTTLSPVRCQLLHRRAGRALEQMEPDALAALARHFEAGGRMEKALHYHSLAAQQAEATFAWREVEEHQSRMLALLDQLDPGCSQPVYLAQRGQVLVKRAQQRHLQGRLAERDADLMELMALAETSGNESLRLQALIYRTRYLNLGGWYEKSITTAEEGLALAEHLNDTSARCDLLVQIGFAHYFLGQPWQGLTALESALALAEEKAGPEILGSITHHLGYVCLHLGEYAEALAYMQEAYACHQEMGDYNGMAWAGLDIGFLHLKLGHFAEAERHLTESLALTQRIGVRPAEAYALTYLGYWQLYRGDYAAAADRLQQTLPMQQAVQYEHGAVAAEMGIGFAFYHLGDLAKARHWLQGAVKRARAVAHRRRLAKALIGLGLVELADDEPLAAHCYLTEAVELARSSECRENLALGLAILARIKRQQGDLAGAMAYACEAMRTAQEIGLAVCEMLSEMETGLALLAQGKVEAALEHTERAIALLPQAHEGWIGTEEVHRAHARVLQALGRIEEADEQDRRAQAIIAAKADRIPDPQQRRRYLQSVKRDV
ncbi:MAG: AAA family ATPase [Anaerolineae bacterium]|nr:AAA family ATPase [Anaerolineae bacterium]